MDCLSRPYLFKFFKGFLPQILLDPFLNARDLKLVHFAKIKYSLNLNITTIDGKFVKN